MSNKVVSVLTVVKNNFGTIDRTINSVLNQKYKNFEYIIIDGKSTDGTLDVIEKYKHHLAYFTSEVDKGPDYAMRKALKVAKGDYIFLLNGDDWIENDYLYVAVKLLENNPNYGYVHGDIVLHSPLKSFLCRGNEKAYDLLKYDMKINTPSTIYKKECFEYAFYDSKYKVAHDYDIFLQLKKSKISGLYSNKIKVNFTLGGNSSKFKYQARKEILLISIKNGSNIIFSSALFLKEIIKLVMYDTLIAVRNSLKKSR